MRNLGWAIEIERSRYHLVVRFSSRGKGELIMPTERAEKLEIRVQVTATRNASCNVNR